MPWTQVDSNEYLDWRSRELLELVFLSTLNEFIPGRKTAGIAIRIGIGITIKFNLMLL
jgi:hypothetical protein